MTVNLFFILFAAFLLGKMIEGNKRGMIKEIISFITLIILGIVTVLLVNGLRSYLQKEMVNLVVCIIILLIVSIVHQIIRVFFFTAKLVSKLPVIHWVDKLAGIIVGALEGVLFLWILYFFIMLLDLGSISEWILKSTMENEVLSWLYSHNYLIYFLEKGGISNFAAFL